MTIQSSLPIASDPEAEELSSQQRLLLSVAATVSLLGRVQGARLQLRWNAGVRALYGLKAGQRSPPGGPLLNKYVSAADQARLSGACERLAVHGESVDERFHADVAGQLRCMRVVLQRVSGSATRIEGVLHDCTAETQVERELQSMQQRLQSAGRLILLGEVASGLAHELNQPLAAITTFAQAGERMLGLPEPKLDRAQQVFREVSQQALRAGDIIRHMRSLIKRHTPQRESVACSALMRDFLILAEPMARTNRIQLRQQVESLEATVWVDLAEIYQVMMILLQNALEATREHGRGQQQVTVVMQCTDTRVRLAFEDQGPGVSEMVAQHMFQPFFSTKEYGTGLGLLSCRNILQSYGCDLQFANLSSGGCRFWFELPVT